MSRAEHTHFCVHQTIKFTVTYSVALLFGWSLFTSFVAVVLNIMNPPTNCCTHSVQKAVRTLRNAWKNCDRDALLFFSLVNVVRCGYMQQCVQFSAINTCVLCTENGMRKPPEISAANLSNVCDHAPVYRTRCTIIYKYALPLRII